MTKAIVPAFVFDSLTACVLFLSVLPEVRSVIPAKLGIEAVGISLESHPGNGERNILVLEEELSIDVGQKDLARLGISGMINVAVDSSGDIFLTADSGSKTRLVVFDRRGRFLRSFGNDAGLEDVHAMRITNADEMILYNNQRRMFFVFDKHGVQKRQVKDLSDIRSPGKAFYLDNGNYLFDNVEFLPAEKGMKTSCLILDPAFKKIAGLNGTIFKENPALNEKFNVMDYAFGTQIADGRIFLANPQKEILEIEIYDFAGRLTKTIRRPSQRVMIPENFKRSAFKRMEKGFMGKFKEKFYLPDYFPPFKSISVDDRGIIYVEIYEGGNGMDTYQVDIFKSDGFYVGRTSLHESVARCFRNNRLYAVVGDQGGGQRLIVSRIRWR